MSAAASLEELYDAHVRRLLRLATLLLGDPEAAEDVVQDVFVAVHRRGSVARLDDPAAYLTRAVVNASRSAVRRLVVARRHEPEAQEPRPGADADVVARERRREVVAAVAALPRRQREVVALRFYLDLSEREIAAALGISTGAVKSHASRGAAALRARLQPDLQETR